MARPKGHTLNDEQIHMLLQRFVRGEMNLEQGEQAIQSLRSCSERALPHLLDMIRDPDETIHVTAAELLMALNDHRAVRPLLKLLDDPSLDDWCKLSVFTVLQRYEVPVDLETLYRRLRDPESVVRHSQAEILKGLTRGTQLFLFLHLLESAPSADQVEILDRLVSTQDPRVLRPLHAALHMPRETVVLAAIEGLDRLRAAVAIPWLEKLARYGATDTIRREAGKVAGHLTMRASVPGVEVIRELPPLADAQWPLYSCWLSIIDGAGAQIALIARRRADGYLVTADMMLTDQEGLKDCLGADMIPEEEFKEMIAELAQEGLTAVGVTLDRCREVVERGYEQALKLGRQLPLDFFAWEGMLEGDDPRSVPEWPVKEVDIAAHPEILAHSIELLELKEMGSWFFNPDEIQAFAERPRRHFLGFGWPRSRMLRMLRQGVESVVDDARRALLRDRLRCQAWLLAQIYEEDNIWQWAMAASAGLGEEGVPSRNHPLLLGMMAASLDNLLGTTLLGELLEWEEEAWLKVLTAPAPAELQEVPSEWAKLRTFLQDTELKLPADFDGSKLFEADDPKPLLEDTDYARQILRLLNWLESIFDEEINDRFFESGELDWQELRHELGLTPTPEMKSPTLQEIEESLVAGMQVLSCSSTMISRARRLWDDYVLITQGQIRPLNKPKSWAAGMTYLVLLLYFGEGTQSEIGELYGVSGTTVSTRYYTLRRKLGVELFPNPLSKHRLALESLIDLDQMSSYEVYRLTYGHG